MRGVKNERKNVKFIKNSKHVKFNIHKIIVKYTKSIADIKQIKLKASLTIEAAIIVPIILFTIVGGINIGFEMFQQAKETVEIREELKELNPVKIVRKNSYL